MAQTKKQQIGKLVVICGASTCLMLALVWIINAIYWHHVTGSWLDDHITDYELAPIVCIAGAFIFTRVVAPMFDL